MNPSAPRMSAPSLSAVESNAVARNRIASPSTLKRTSLAVAFMLLAGCGAVGLHPLSQTELAERTAADRAAAEQGVDPIAGTLSLDEAVARALKYNLNRRVKMMEEALAANQLDAATWDMLPRLTAQAGYSRRNNDLISRSIDSVTGAPSLANPYISTDREHDSYELGLTWNLLDFGVSYIAAKQQADRVLIASERRRKAMHALVQDVRTAFWRTASAQKLHDEVRRSIALAEDALRDAQQSEAERVRSPIDSLRYQRQLLENLRLLESIEQELASGRIELAQLIDAPLGQDFQVQEPGNAMDKSLLSMPVENMEELALAQNADIREQHYTSRIAVEETKRTMLRMFPNLSFNYGVNHDNDSYLINNTWNQTGVQLSYNVFSLFSAPARKRMADAGVKLADQQRIATQMAVLTQVHLSRLQYQSALHQYELADRIAQADAKIAEHTKNRELAETRSKLDQISENTTAILSLLRRYQSLALLQSAGGKLQATLGLEPEIGSVSDRSLPELTREVGASLAQWQRIVMPESTDLATHEPVAAAALQN